LSLDPIRTVFGALTIARILGDRGKGRLEGSLAGCLDIGGTSDHQDLILQGDLMEGSADEKVVDGTK
jgi:hypothetical protein